MLLIFPAAAEFLPSDPAFPALLWRNGTPEPPSRPGLAQSRRTGRTHEGKEDSSVSWREICKVRSSFRSLACFRWAGGRKMAKSAGERDQAADSGRDQTNLQGRLAMSIWLRRAGALALVGLMALGAVGKIQAQRRAGGIPLPPPPRPPQLIPP